MFARREYFFASLSPGIRNIASPTAQRLGPLGDEDFEENVS
jgi:hypothetical protein